MAERKERSDDEGGCEVFPKALRNSVSKPIQNAA
jgi:hypothetical protein